MNTHEGVAFGYVWGRRDMGEEKVYETEIPAFARWYSDQIDAWASGQAREAMGIREAYRRWIASGIRS